MNLRCRQKQMMATSVFNSSTSVKRQIPPNNMAFNLRSQAADVLSPLQSEISAMSWSMGQVTHMDGIGRCSLSDLFITGIHCDIQNNLRPFLRNFPQKCQTLQLPVALQEIRDLHSS